VPTEGERFVMDFVRHVLERRNTTAKMAVKISAMVTQTGGTPSPARYARWGAAAAVRSGLRPASADAAGFTTLVVALGIAC
jgi:hypothetical protein